ncbi:hypothetical protein [Gracilibacillus saliphilus]|uniref:hypothetical protein n=1 Tax=Gracilibacillus saliphilus TaxID=543890 RepID=UPI001EE30BE4|nr:hypothetical protein [Gracilibacillus saliphilus]
MDNQKFHYKVKCYNCKREFNGYEGSLKYNQYKQNRYGVFCCEDCGHRIRMEAIKNFFRKIINKKSLPQKMKGVVQ